MSTEDRLAAALAAAGLAAAPPGAPDDSLATALAAAGLAAAPAGAPDDSLATALAAAGLVVPTAAPDDPLAAVPVDAGPVATGTTPGAGSASGWAGNAAGGAAASGWTTSARAGSEQEPASSPMVARWPDGVGTGVGSMPGENPLDAATTVVGELPLLPYLPELPARGVGADLIGRSAALLVDLAVELRPSAYRVADRAGREHRRAVDLLRSDLDAFDEACAPARPEWVKVQAAGPWTLAAAIELRSGHRVLTDRGAVREFAASLTEGLRVHVAEVATRTGAKVLLQLDEPGLPAVLEGRLPTASGYGTVRVVQEPEAQDALRDLIDALGVPVAVHCCAPRPPVRLLAGIGAAAIGIDATLPEVSGSTAKVDLLDALGETWDAGIPLLLGLVPALAPADRVTTKGLARPAFDLADRLGFDRVRLATLAVPTPTCGLAGASPRWARQAMTLARELGEMFADPPDED